MIPNETTSQKNMSTLIAQLLNEICSLKKFQQKINLHTHILF